VVERVVHFSAQCNAAFLTRPIQLESFGKRDIQVRLSRTFYNACSAVPKRCPPAVRADYGRPRETGDIEVSIQLCFDRASPHSLAVRALAAPLRSVFADAKDVHWIGIRNR